MTVLQPLSAWILDQHAAGKFYIHFAAVEAALPGRTRRSLLAALDRLVVQGYLFEWCDERIANPDTRHGPRLRNPTWRIKDPKGLASRPGPKPHPNKQRDRMWRLIRAKKRFTRFDLITLASASEDAAHAYSNILENAGLIRRVAIDHGIILYQLARDLGPERPRLPENTRAPKKVRP